MQSYIDLFSANDLAVEQVNIISDLLAAVLYKFLKQIQVLVHA
jgi:hypothetical protein